MTPGLMSIGRFARLTRLSVQQLRRYDEQGLLVPAAVDPASGYRFYASSQVRLAATIGLLRELDVPLAVVGELLAAGPDRVAELLAGERERRVAELGRAACALAAVSQLAEQAGLPEVAVAIEHRPASCLAALQAPAAPQRMAAVTQSLAAQLVGLAPDPAVPFTGLFPLDLPLEFNVVLGFDLPDHAPTPSGTRLLTLPAGFVASAEHHGPVDTVALTWWPLLAWVHERGLTPTGSVRERYLNETSTTLAVPIEKE